MRIPVAETAWHESGHGHRELFETLPVGIYQSTMDGKVLMANQACMDIARCPVSEREAFFAQDTRKSYVKHKDGVRFRELLVEHGSVQAYEAPMRRWDGTVAWLSNTARLIRDSRGEPVVIVGSFIDVTARREAEDALRESEARLNLALKVANMGYWRFDCATNVVEWSDGHEKLFGITLEEFEGTLDAVQRCVHPDDRTLGLENMKKALDEDVPFDNTYRVVHPDGDVRLLHSYGFLRRDDKGRPDHFFGVTQDITESMRLQREKQLMEERLQQAQKMDSIGRLAGGVAHDFNNMLAVILGRADLAMRKISPSHSIYRDLDEIRQAAERSAELTAQLLAFGRQSAMAPRIVNLNDIVSGVLKMLERLIGEEIVLSWRPGPDLWHAKVDPVRMNQILVNLCVNARDAIAGQGAIDIETENRLIVEAPKGDKTVFPPGEYVCVSVRDDGCGMDEAMTTSIFEPFFTTKELGKGSGLGLSVVYGAVEQLGGFITVKSEPDKGSVFRVNLPRTLSEGEVERSKVSNPSLPEGEETILLVENVLSVLELTATMLQQLGYRVLSASGPDQAIEVARSYANAIHLLISDVVMPKMDGRNLARILTRMRPDLKVLHISGRPYEADICGERAKSDAPVIMKPFTVEDLAVKVRELLDR